MEDVDLANYVPKNNTKHKLPRISPDEVVTGDTTGQNEVCRQGRGCGHGHGCGHGNQSTTQGSGFTRGRGRGRLVVKRRIQGAVQEKRSLEESIQMVKRIIGKKMRELTE